MCKQSEENNTKKVRLPDKATLIFLALIAVFAIILVVGIVHYASVCTLQDEFVESTKQQGRFHGELVGVANGSVDGLIVELPQGYGDGVEEGLSAKDTVVELQLTVRDVGKLEVLSADFKAHKKVSVGDVYSSLKVHGGEIIFTVDLAKAVIQENGSGELVAVLPLPVADIYIDDAQTELLGEWSKYQNSGSAESGYEAASNERNNIIANAEHEIVGYADMMQSAKNSAIKSVQLILESVSISDRAVTVVFEGEG